MCIPEINKELMGEIPEQLEASMKINLPSITGLEFCSQSVFQTLKKEKKQCLCGSSAEQMVVGLGVETQRHSSQAEPLLLWRKLGPLKTESMSFLESSPSNSNTKTQIKERNYSPLLRTLISVNE